MLAGLPIGLFAALLGVGVAAGGHGWVSAFFASLILPLAYPLSLWRWISDRDLRLDALPLLAAMAANAWLVRATLREWDYFAHMWVSAAVLMAIWVVLWFGWQAIALGALARRPVRRA